MMSEDDEIINFAAVGDISTNPDSKKTLDGINSNDPEIILFLGDLGYAKPADWFEFADYLGTDKSFPTLGNHDYAERDVYLKHYGLHTEFYSFNFRNVHFISLDTEADFHIDSSQYKFLIQDLESLSNTNETDWTIVFFHKPIYTDSGSHPPFIKFRNIIQPIFDKYDVDIVLQGHNHIYERSRPLTFNNTITDDSTDLFLQPTGQIYLTVGTGGDSHYSFKQISNWSLKQIENDFGFINIIMENKNELSFEFISNNGEILDSFKIVK